MSRRSDAADLAGARALLARVTDWITARDGGVPPTAAAVEAAAVILAKPPALRGTWVSVHPATVYGVGGHLVVLYHDRDIHGPVIEGRCSCDPAAMTICEHFLVALAGEKLQ